MFVMQYKKTHHELGNKIFEERKNRKNFIVRDRIQLSLKSVLHGRTMIHLELVYVNMWVLLRSFDKGHE